MTDFEGTCRCGHEFDSHHFDGDEETVIMEELGDSWCADCDPAKESFHDYRPDNLTYLERKYDNERLH